MPSPLESEMHGALRRAWLVVGWIGIAGVVYGSLMHNPPSVPMPQGDKVEHLSAYGLLMFWFAQVIMGSRSRAAVALGLVALGVALEFAQSLTDYRTFEIADMVGDAAGVVLGWIIAPPRTPGLARAVARRLRRTR